MPQAAFGLMVAGGLWLVLWRGWTRLAGVVSFMAGAMWAWVSPVPDILITGDGRHVGGVRTGKVHLLRPRTGDQVRDLNSGVTAGPDTMMTLGTQLARSGRALFGVALRKWA